MPEPFARPRTRTRCPARKISRDDVFVTVSVVRIASAGAIGAGRRPTERAGAAGAIRGHGSGAAEGTSRPTLHASSVPVMLAGFWIACAAAPFKRLSSAATATTPFVLGSIFAPTRARDEYATDAIVTASTSAASTSPRAGKN